jgi:hypothetical protein
MKRGAHSGAPLFWALKRVEPQLSTHRTVDRRDRARCGHGNGLPSSGRHRLPRAAVGFPPTDGTSGMSTTPSPGFRAGRCRAGAVSSTTSPASTHRSSASASAKRPPSIRSTGFCTRLLGVPQHAPGRERHGAGGRCHGDVVAGGVRLGVRAGHVDADGAMHAVRPTRTGSSGPRAAPSSCSNDCSTRCGTVTESWPWCAVLPPVKGTDATAPCAAVCSVRRRPRRTGRRPPPTPRCPREGVRRHGRPRMP